MRLERMSDGEIDEAAFFGFVDGVKGDARASAHAIEEQLAIPCFAYGACRDRTHVADVVAVDDLTEPFNRRKCCIRGLRADDSAGKRVASEEDAARRFLDDREWAVLAAISAMTSRMALAPMSSTATKLGTVELSRSAIPATESPRAS